MQKKRNIQIVVKIALLLLLPALHHAQIVMGSGPADGSAQLELQSTDKGMLIPRLTTTQRDAIASPAMGLMIYNTSTYCLEINVGTASAPQWGLMNCRTGVIATLDCGNTVVTGTLSPGQAASGVSASVPYTGGNEGVHTGQTVTSTGVTGFTATLSAGRFANGAGNLTYDITGTPASAGTATFALNIGGQACNLNVPVSYVCKAKINATTYRDFMCYNLGAASTSADPFTPSWEINGGYWQWGRSAEAAAGPTGPDPGQANDGTITGWNSTYAPNGSWTDGSKTANDPCPSGFRVPTRAQWDGVIANNTKTNVGTFSSSATNYSAGKKFGDNLMLPAAGDRNYFSSTLSSRGRNGTYWSSTVGAGTDVWSLGFGWNSTYTDDSFYVRSDGCSVRCIAELQGTLGALDCGNAVVTGTLNSGQAASGVSASVPYTGGNEGIYTGQTVTSTGVTGLTATLSAGTFASGAGNLTYDITGTPASGATASFALSIGGQTCNLNVTVSSAPVCRAKVNATDYRNFMCYNLGAANTSADPFTPGWEINGGYWQWGRKVEAAAGPTGPAAGQANSSAINGWNTTGAPNGSWADGSKTGDDPCPSGFRVPTKAQWEGVIANNTPQTNVGTFSNNATNYGAGKKFGDNLMLPAAGFRNFGSGTLGSRGSYGYYWSSTENGASNAWYLNFYIDDAYTNGNYRTNGLSVRCIAE